MMTGLPRPALIAVMPGRWSAASNCSFWAVDPVPLTREPRVELLAVLRRRVGQVGEAGSEDRGGAECGHRQDRAEQGGAHGHGGASPAAFESMAHTDQRAGRRPRGGQGARRHVRDG